MSQTSLEELRKNLNLLDQELIRALQRRAAIARQIGQVKSDSGIKCSFSPIRESEVFKALRQISPKDMAVKDLEQIFVEIVSACRGIQGDTSLCILGEKHGWVNDCALSRYGQAVNYSSVENFEDFISSICKDSNNLGFAAFSPQYSIDLLLLVETLFSGKLSIVEEFSVIPEFCVVSNSARDLSEVHEICVTGEMLQLMRSYFISLSFDLKIKICRSMSEAYENLQSINPVAAVLPAALVKHNPDLRLIKSGLRSDAIGAVKFLTLSAQPLVEYRAGLKTTLLCAVSHSGDRLFDIIEVLRQHGLKVSDIHSIKYSGKPWETIMIIELMAPETSEKFAALIRDLEARCLLVKSCGFYPVFR